MWFLCVCASPTSVINVIEYSPPPTHNHPYIYHSTWYSVCTNRSHFLSGEEMSFVLWTICPMWHVVNKVLTKCSHSFIFFSILCGGVVVVVGGGGGVGWGGGGGSLPGARPHHPPPSHLITHSLSHSDYPGVTMRGGNSGLFPMITIVTWIMRIDRTAFVNKRRHFSANLRCACFESVTTFYREHSI